MVNEATSAMTEYREACDNVRHFSAMLSANLTICASTFAAMVVVGLSGNTPGTIPRFYVSAAGLIITVMYWILAERVSILLATFSAASQYHRKQAWLQLPFHKTKAANRVPEYNVCYTGNIRSDSLFLGSNASAVSS